ncbi:hypothetical protein M406DRAFT_356767 [Cryphonectria parasitica EP155]|uniref:Uncharacterized protein n=1 Tax=Cryphonectria parasitica (strain ATCC 38755 / EP155) TaxID=660469 RepID=A0A9P4Y222_CRYP1|nr:uncharacterized protein M406DRAFT_356767 [Cryphonectria parasitica EP155]KAF3765010.1 hypothetical protein M406DRAFT_356767 [Cryphonectria parasitica EP155]
MEEDVDVSNAATVTVMAGQSSTTTLTVGGGTTSVPPTTTITITKTLTTSWTGASSTSSSSTTSSAATATASSTFTVTQEVLDFARVGVLFILQEEQLSDASTAQTALESFFESSAQTATAASNISLANGNTIDLVNFHIDVGTGLVGSLITTKKRELDEAGSIHL